jgi:hypothetical protein
MIMPRGKIVLGPMALRACKDGLVLQSERSRERHPDARDVHLTLLTQGDRASHVTITPADERKPWRDDLSAEWFSPPRLVELLGKAHCLLAQHWISSMVRVDLDELTAQGIIAFPIPDAAPDRRLSGLAESRGKGIAIRDLGRFEKAMIELMCEHATLPSELPSLGGLHDGPFFACHVADDGSLGQELWLTFSARQKGDQSCWHAVPAVAFAPAALREVFRGQFDSGLFAELRRVAWHFGAE